MRDFCIITHLPSNQLQLVYKYSVDPLNYKTSFGSIVFQSNSARNICRLMVLHKTVYNSLTPDHSLYLGCELTKAEFALWFEQYYIQD